MNMVANRSGGQAAFAVVGLLMSTPAWAVPGEHISAGDAIIVPGVALGVQYTNNAYHVEQVGPEDGAVNLLFSPGVELRLNRDDLDVNLSGAYSLHKYFSASTVALDRYDDFSLNGTVNALKKSRIGLRLNEAVGISNFPVDAQSDAHPYTKQFRNQTSASIAARPGTALEFAVGGKYALDDYGTPATAHSDGTRHYNTRHSYGPTGNVNWQLLPRTAVVADFSWEHAYYMTPSITDSEGNLLTFPDHNIWRLTGGLRGRVIDRLTVTAIVGYGSAVYDEASVAGTDTNASADLTGIQHLLFDAAFRYDLSEDDKFNVGVNKDFRDSFFTNYVSYVRAYASADLRFGERIGLNGEFGISPENFRGEATRDDIALDAKLSATYFIREWVWVTAGGGWQERSSTDTEIQFDEFTGSLTATVNY